MGRGKDIKKPPSEVNQKAAVATKSGAVRLCPEVVHWECCGDQPAETRTCHCKGTNFITVALRKPALSALDSVGLELEFKFGFIKNNHFSM
jgi:hypothetical protein